MAITKKIAVGEMVIFGSVMTAIRLDINLSIENSLPRTRGRAIIV